MNDNVLKSNWLILILISLLGWGQGFAQYKLKSALHAGITESEFEGSYFAKRMVLKPYTGKFIGFTVTADFNRSYELSTGFFISEKGYKASFNENYYYEDVFGTELSIDEKKAEYRFDEDLELTYLEFPFIIKKRITALAAVLAGFNVNVLLNSNIENKYIGYYITVDDEGNETFRTHRLGRSSDASFFFGGEIRATEWLGLTFQYEYGLIKLDQHNLTDTKINTLKIGLFYVFSKH